MNKRFEWTDERQEQLERMWNGLVPLVDIAKHFGISRPTVCKQARKAGLKRRFTSAGARVPPWEEQDATLIRMVLAGKQNDEIAEELGRSEAAVQCRKNVMRQRGQLPRVKKSWSALRGCSRPVATFKRKTRTCLTCREPFQIAFKDNWICRKCTPVVNEAQGAIA